jgi:pimeloyl-ACP methyl ester carboxylesterase
MSGYRFADMSADLLAFQDAMGLRTAIIVGHSMGASVAQRFAIDYPDRVERLALMGAFSTFDDPGLAEFVASSIAPLTDPIAAPFAREWQLSTLARAMPADHLDAVVSETLKVPARVWREAFDGFLKTPDFTSEPHRPEPAAVPARQPAPAGSRNADRPAEEGLPGLGRAQDPREAPRPLRAAAVSRDQHRACSARSAWAGAAAPPTTTAGDRHDALPHHDAEHPLVCRLQRRVSPRQPAVLLSAHHYRLRESVPAHL